MDSVGYQGHYTNHSQRVSCATILLETEVYEQLVIERSGHCSTDGVRTNKR